MAVTKYANDLIMDAALNYIKTNAVKMYVTTAAISSASVVSYTKITSTAALTGAISTAAIASVALGAGDTSGKKLAIPEFASVAVVASGAAARVCLVNSSGSVVVYTTTCTSQSVVSGNTITIPTWDIEIRDAT